MGVIGMGGLFFRARDPEGLAAWYKEHLGVGGGCVAELDVNVIAPARAITVFSLPRTGTLEALAASEGTPSAAIHASVPYLTHSSYGSTPKPQLPQTSPQEFCTTKPILLKPAPPLSFVRIAA